MNLKSNLAIAKQAFENLLKMCELTDVPIWSPSKEQREAYISFAECALDSLEKLENFEQRQLFTEGLINSRVPESLLTFMRKQLIPRVPALRIALDHLDPQGKMGRDLLSELEHLKSGCLVRGTFDKGLQRIYSLIDDDPEADLPLMPDAAYEVLDSKLIQFDPDGWLDRASQLLPVRTHKINFNFPAHIRLRLEELYRVYVFGCCLSVFSLSRAILEYSIIDNLNKFQIDPLWPPGRNGERTAKKLTHLIADVSKHLPQYEKAMTILRDYGNEYMHPKKSKVSKILQPQEDAQKVVSTLVEVLEAIYLAPRET